MSPVWGSIPTIFADRLNELPACKCGCGTDCECTKESNCGCDCWINGKVYQETTQQETT